MEVQVGNVLVGAAVGDKTVAARFQVKFGDQTLHRLEQIDHDFRPVSMRTGDRSVTLCSDRRGTRRMCSG